MGATPAEGDLLLGRYTLGPLVGLGGTAKVFRAWDHEGGGTVAVKVFPPGSASPTRDGSREREVLTGVRHAGLIEVRDSGVNDEGFPFVVMDFVEGESLAARLRRGPMPPAVVAELGATLATALAHVHERGIVHRDIKPGNVLLDEDGRPWLADFGIARIVDATRVTATGVVVGTAAYMAPEQVRGEAVGPPADVYALGLVLLEAATGRREYDGGALESALARLNRSPRVPSDVPDPLAATIRGMTLGEPDERPSAAQVAAALGEPPERLDPPSRHVGRRLAPVGALALLATTALGGALLLGAGSTGGAGGAGGAGSQAADGAGPDFGSAPSGVPAAPRAAAPPAPVAAAPVAIAPVAAAAQVAAAAPAGVAPAPAARAAVAAPRPAAASSADAGSPRPAVTTQSAAGQTASTAVATRAQDDQGDQAVAKGENENKGNNNGKHNGKHNGVGNGNGNKGNGNNGNGQGED